MTIQQADQYFAALPEGFALPQQLQAAVGGLADQVTFVGVAGTAGKTAAASLLAAMLQAAGLHAGLYCAGAGPLSARILVDGKPAAEYSAQAELLSAGEELPRLAAELAAAARCFGAAGCALAVVELPDAGLASALPRCRSVRSLPLGRTASAVPLSGRRPWLPVLCARAVSASQRRSSPKQPSVS